DAFLRLEDGLRKAWKAPIEVYGYNFCGIISKENWLLRAIELKLGSFYFTWQGMIDFSYLKSIKLKFIDYIIHQDHYFGMILFCKLKHIFTLSLKLYNYRIRNNSTIHYNEDIVIPEYLMPIYLIFKDKFLLKQYHSKASLCLTLFSLLEFINESKDTLFVKAFLPTSILMCQDILNIKHDPWNVKDKFLVIFQTYIAITDFFPHS
ncbi:hypothetical protein H2256_07540, partial [Campylobacter sp. RM9929]|nr:hypothetical protein [Campylobacter sp. RM9929]